MSEPLSLIPKLVVDDADAAVDFYRRAFAATLVERYTAGDKVVFAGLELLGSRISLKEADDADPSPRTLGRPGVVLEITTDDPDAVADAVVAAGGSVVFAVADQPYGSRAGRIRDPYGHEWLVQTPITLPPDEVQRRLG